MDIESLYRVYKQHPDVSTDSRRIPEGCMFFALKGDTFNGNLFAAKALEAGAAVAVVDEAEVVPADDKRYILVDDVLTALQQLAAHHRQQFSGPVLQVTGTNGKTTTKELIAAVLQEKYRVLYTQGNLNNHIGVPLTLLRLRTDKHEIAVIETGANHPKEIEFLTNIVRPTCGLVTNVGVAHIEGFGSFEGVKRTKGELYDYLLNTDGCRLFLAACNKDLVEMVEERRPITLPCPCNDGSLYLSIIDGQVDEDAVVHGQIVPVASPYVAFSWQQGEGKAHTMQSHLIGAYNLDNLMAAVAIGLNFGVQPEAIDHAITSYEPSLGRSEFRQTESNRLIVDAYNANLTSMKAALLNFESLSLPDKMVILGDMKELGTDSEEAHAQVLDIVGQCASIGEVWLVGKCWNDSRYRHFADVEAVKAYIAEHKPTDKTILIKGSNSIKLHQLPAVL